VIVEKWMFNFSSMQNMLLRLRVALDMLMLSSQDNDERS